MKKLIKSILPPSTYKAIRKYARARKIRSWKQSGSPSPPPRVYKQHVIQQYAKHFSISTFVETGTFRGDTLAEQSQQFSRLISIEISPKLHQAASTRFENQKHIELLLGDSGKLLHELVPRIKEAALFWLDGHYSGPQTGKGDKECPIMEELNALIQSPVKHVWLIDDARCFTGEHDYPALKTLVNWIQKNRPDYHVMVLNDIIRVCPNEFKPTT